MITLKLMLVRASVYDYDYQEYKFRNYLGPESQAQIQRSCDTSQRRSFLPLLCYHVESQCLYIKKRHYGSQNHRFAEHQ